MRIKEGIASSLIRIIVLFFISLPVFSENIIIPEFKGGVKPDAVWTNYDGMMPRFFEYCRKRSHDEAGYQSCLSANLPHHGASQQAIAFNRVMQGKIESYRNYGFIDVVLADLISTTLNKTVIFFTPLGQLIDVNEQDINNKLELSKNALYLKLIHQYPKARLGRATSDHIKLISEPSNAKIKQFLVSYPIWMNAKEEAMLGMVNVDYGFRVNGDVQAIKLMNIVIYPKPVISVKKPQSVNVRGIAHPEHAPSGMSESINLLPQKKEALPYGIAPSPGVREGAH